MRALLFAATAAAALVAAAAPAAAAQITYTFNGTFSGTLGGNPFTVPATFTGVGDTNSANNNGFGFNGITSVPFTTFSALSGGTTYNVTTPGFFYLYGPSFGLSNVTRLGFGFGAGGTNAVGLESAAFDGYDGVSGFPTTTASVYFANAQFSTDQGDVVINGVTDASFAAAVPEPATWAMMIGGVGLVGGAMRRRRSTVTTRVTFA